MLSESEFDRLNARRIELIEKQHSGFTEEESQRSLDRNPGWKEECERRYRANLSEDERVELEDLQKQTGEHLNQLFPQRVPPHIQELLDEMRNSG